MDRTPLRLGFFNWSSVPSASRKCTISRRFRRCRRGIPIGPLPPGCRWLLSRAALRLAPGLFAWQYVFIAEPLTGSNA